MQYSKRLTSFANQLIFVFVGLAGTAELLMFRLSQPLILFAVVPMLIAYLSGGTFVWAWTQRTGRYRAIYYAVMLTLGSGIIILATWVLKVGIGAAIIILPLATHGALLSQRSRFMFISGLMMGIFVSAFLVQPLINGLLALMAVSSGVAAFDFVGRVIVSEEQAHEQLARYSKEVEELSIMRERNRLAREIHDNLGHYLTAINMQAQAAQAILSHDSQQAEEALTNIQNLAREGLQEVRKSITALRASPMENLLLHEALETLVSDAQGRGLRVDFQIVGEPVSSSAEIEMTIYRILQEAFTNIHKHAHAKKAVVTLRYQKSPDMIALKVCDDGIGIDKPDGGFGLLGLRERIRLLGGNFQIQTAPGKGFCIEVEVVQ